MTTRPWMIPALSAAILAGSIAGASAQRAQVGGSVDIDRRGTRTETTGSMRGGGGEMRTSGGSRTEDQRGGANQRGFCPPGQRKKPGKGSAFQC